ncbi:glutamyl-tRNA amidotransferase [Caloranaerobacter azorensis H53214]|uniref:Aspartyl/glutamyl-tRNA(Asn/Gln) amidotransferase subunit B n=1 Tax=Caloranaerobacter azorensis H53214 TaxID=1156417 RepID=A0A096BGT4_9FIRM|nr:Asp-tRNA(Asn)/Glu-tRNA(Gln) amidotransferase subunit GatB [Caloranaerobacter azorensis]KGG80410.1 glutamyl-tRNA amidotransferase [Caloranaerobacter azorensis H53214]
MAYKTIIGLEIHVELLTKTKIFCGCLAEFGREVNTNCCPVCLGLPGALPVLNKKVVEYCIRAGLALNCKISNRSRMDRKNYFYPDLVKGYQITQYNNPLCKDGYIKINTKHGEKKIRIKRIHIEEDTGKSIYDENGNILLDYNRSGVPLIEIVTYPDMNSPEEARMFLEKLKVILKYIEISDCKMEEGSLRCDININVIDEKTKLKSTITEIKNLNSFKAAVKAMEFEEKRHIELLKHRENTLKETRKWDENKNETVVMRGKETVEDYRYFPEPDLVEIEVDENWIRDIKENLPELPDNRKERFMREYNLPEYDANVLTSSKELANFFEETVKINKNPKQVSNWIMGNILRWINASDMDISKIKFTHKDFANLLELINNGKISNNIGKKVLKIMFEEGKNPEAIIEERGLLQISDVSELECIIDRIIEENKQSVEEYKNGKEKVLGFLIGQVMKITNGKANPQLVNRIILEKLKQ